MERGEEAGVAGIEPTQANRPARHKPAPPKWFIANRETSNPNLPITINKLFAVQAMN
jgi:hypothetical protein